VHVNDNRSAKGLIEAKITELFRQEFEDVTLKIQPSVPGAAFRAAVDEDRITKVCLTRLERPHDRAIAATDKWVEAGEAARVELQITGGRGKRISAKLLKRFVAGDAKARSGALHDIIEFENMTFEEAKVEAVLADGKRRTFNISAPEAGHAFTVDLTDLDICGFTVRHASLFDSLRVAIAGVSGLRASPRRHGHD